MTRRISAKFRELRRYHRKALIPFLVAGFPSLKKTGELIFALERSGADIIELGIPFSDPMADGPVIQRAYERALKKGVTLKKILGLVRRIRKASQTPIVLMGYYNTILSYGLKSFASDSRRAGVDGVLVVDLPPEESMPLRVALRKNGIDLIGLLAPTSDKKRIRLAAKRGSGYLYYVSMTGITGSRLTDLREVRKKIRQIRRTTKLPIVVGFGIQTVAQARELGRCTDGVVIGSTLVKAIDGSRDPVKLATMLIRRFRYF